MSDWPRPTLDPPGGVVFVGASRPSYAADACQLIGATFASGAVWPAANRAIYCPFAVETTVTAFQMAFEVTVQSGNCDVGIYTEQGVLLVSAGSTAVGAAGVQRVNIADTELKPGVYFMAMNVDNTTAAIARSGPGALLLQATGVQQQAVGAVALPNPATFANPASAYVPGLAVALRSVI